MVCRLFVNMQLFFWSAFCVDGHELVDVGDWVGRGKYLIHLAGVGFEETYLLDDFVREGCTLLQSLDDIGNLTLLGYQNVVLVLRSMLVDRSVCTESLHFSPLS